MTLLIKALTELEQEVVDRMGYEKVQKMMGFVLEYDRILNEILNEKSEQTDE